MDKVQIKDYAKRRALPAATDVALQAFGDLRNVLIHRKYSVHGYMAAPVPGVVQAVERIRDDMLRPTMVLSRFRQQVTVLQVNDTLTQALALALERDYSQFPVYEGETFKGLVTENGITRWLAVEVAETIIDFDDVMVKDVLRREERRQSYTFVRAQTTLNAAIGAFGRNPQLEAILITSNGRRHEKLLGIITAWDIARLQ